MSDFLKFMVLHVDLSDRKVTTYTLPEKNFHLYLGGRGLNAKILFEGVPKGIDPLGNENLLIFSTGKFVGTPVPTAGQLTITAKSPATGFYFKSNTGGSWAKTFRRAGWDALVITGGCTHPVYLYIEDEHVTFHDASSMWGKTVR